MRDDIKSTLDNTVFHLEEDVKNSLVWRGVSSLLSEMETFVKTSKTTVLKTSVKHKFDVSKLTLRLQDEKNKPLHFQWETITIALFWTLGFL